jgi:hypothetical protein
MPKSNPSSHNAELRFQWSLQRSVKIKSIPWLVSELKTNVGPIKLPEMEDRFNFKYSIVKAVGVADKSRPFMRTMDFLKNDLQILNPDYSLKPEWQVHKGPENLYEQLYDAASTNFIPFQTMTAVFARNPVKVHSWEDFKLDLSREMISKAKRSYPNAFTQKNKKESVSNPLGIYGWRMEDNSINRLVELGMLFGVCSFIVLDHVRFISLPDWKGKGMEVSIDFNDLVTILRSSIPDFGPTMILGLDQIFAQTDKKGVLPEVVEDALKSGGRKVSFFTGGNEGMRLINISGTNYYGVRFSEECFR